MNPENFYSAKSMTAENNICGPVYVTDGKVLVATVTGTFVGAVAFYINISVNDRDVPSTSDTKWALINSYTAPDAKMAEASGWYMAKCTQYTSGIIETIMRAT
jgi:hypothetical protein